MVYEPEPDTLPTVSRKKRKIPTSTQVVSSKKRKINKSNNWMELQDVAAEIQAEPSADFIPPLSLSADSDPMDFFSLFFNEKIMELIVKETVTYAMSKKPFHAIGDR